jgi:hypothetical protein
MKMIKQPSHLSLIACAMLVAGCHPVSQDEFDALEADYLELKRESHEWVNGVTGSMDPLDDYIGVTEWQAFTHNVICDIKVKNDPNNGAYTTGFRSTEAYCAPADAGTGAPHDPPPPFGV